MHILQACPDWKILPDIDYCKSFIGYISPGIGQIILFVRVSII